MPVLPCFYCVFSHTLHTSVPVSVPHTANHRTNPCTLFYAAKWAGLHTRKGCLRRIKPLCPKLKRTLSTPLLLFARPQKSVTYTVNSAANQVARLGGSPLTFQESHAIENN